jgi:hypothetical protein
MSTTIGRLASSAARMSVSVASERTCAAQEKQPATLLDRLPENEI